MRALLLVILVLPGCRAYSAFAWKTSGNDRVVEATQTERVPFACPRAATWVAVTFDIDLRAGALEVAVRDPAGEERVRAIVEPDTRARELEFRALPGEWIAELVMEKFSGSYRVSWRSGSGATSAPDR
jgi:hypothetical protein